MIRVGQKRGTGLQSEAIETLTDSQWSHTLIEFLAPFVGIDAHGDRITIDPGNVIEAWEPFVRKLDNVAAGHPTGTIIDYFYLRETLTHDEFNAIAKFLCRQVGKPYARKDCIARAPGLSHFIAPPDPGLHYQNYDKWFCSELAAAGFEICGRNLFNFRPAWRIEPGLIPESLQFDRTFKTETV